MEKIKIVFLCHFSNANIRQVLELKSICFRRFLMKLLHIPDMHYDDYAIWVSDYIEEFEKHSDCEFHIVAPHFGMKKKYQNFDMNGILYHFWGYRDGLFHFIVNKVADIDRKSNYSYNRKRIQTIVNSISPDLVCLCGAENPYYSLGVLDVKEKPTYVILQTFLNDKKRIEMGVGDAYRRLCEKRVFQHAGYFCTQDTNAIAFIKEINTKAQIMPTRFPTHMPVVEIPKEKESDFVFFARTITANKGIEDVLQAISLVKESIKDVKLILIGGLEKDYHLYLQKVITNLGIADNVIYKGYYQDINDTYKEVLKASVAVVPGITATLNSTVRESMFMGLPTICYEDLSTIEINRNKQCLITAKMRNIEDLASLMLDAIQNQERTKEIAQNGKQYANEVFGNEAIVNQFLTHCRVIVEDYKRQMK